ncbi:MAG: DUF512 domain-containing protein [Halanaerobiaceae bacterium]
MDSRLKYFLLRTVQDHNILPLTSVCDLACIFCSHRQNPPGIDVYRPGHLDLELIEELIGYLPPAGPVILGESATRIIEGEPLLHPDFKEVIYFLRGRFPDKEIRITTAGSRLTPELISFLKSVEPVYINLSLNCPTPEARKNIMKDRKPGAVFRALPLLEAEEIRFSGSIVALPHLPQGVENLYRTVAVLSHYNPRTVRVFLPGYTSYSAPEMKFGEDIPGRLRGMVAELASKYKFPVLMEPPLLTDLTCEVIGVIPDSPADGAGFERGDIIREIAGEKPLTRVQAFNMLRRRGNSRVLVGRYGESVELWLEKEAGRRPGVVMDCDLAARDIMRLKQIVQEGPAQNICLVTSRFAYSLLKHISDNIIKCENIDVVAVKNKYFGGSIGSAGLLTVEDIFISLEKREKEYGKIILPGIIFDNNGNDLKGESKDELAQSTNSEVIIL